LFLLIFKIYMVGTAGFEPATTTPPVWCATRLRYAPKYSTASAVWRTAIIPKRLSVTSQTIYLFEVILTAVTEADLPEFTELSKFPEVRRDLAILINREVEAQDVLKTVKEVAGDELQNLRLFDIYEGKGVDLKQKSLALGLTYQHSSRTLNEDEVNASIERVVDQLQTRFSATLRN
jgi:phenylalanyl-tRNA synthetase beta subunit